MREALVYFFDYINTVVLIYFAVSATVYTGLMLLSLYTVTLHSRIARQLGYGNLSDSPVTPPVTLIIPAYNEEAAIVATATSMLELNYPEKEVIVVDDGSTDHTVSRLVQHFQLQRVEMVYRGFIPAQEPLAFYLNPQIRGLLVVSKLNGGKSDALNVGINLARTPYFCTVDADSIIERDALLRLMAPVVHSNVNTIVSGGVVRIANGSTLERAEVRSVALPKAWLERCQVVEYLRTFLFGRPGWNVLNATFICSGAFCLLQREAVVLAGGFSNDTVTEDIDIIAKLHRYQKEKGWKYHMVFTTDPVCWTEAPHDLHTLAKQRRRWQLGLVQTVMRHNQMIFNPKFGTTGMLSMPFHAYVEALGCVIEALGTILLPFSLIFSSMPLGFFALILMFAIAYGTALSMTSILLADATVRRYPGYRDVMILMLYTFVENFGYRQIITFFRAHGVLQYFLGEHRWEVVKHGGFAARAQTAPAVREPSRPEAARA
jgi:cellulose synthase/poly-beta-1,6-N-acetylglucosamine synthase-like glycosyltransferase